MEVLYALLILAAAANPFATTGPNAEVDLIVAATSVKPGDTVEAGVRFRIRDGWHTYWQNPGDSGTPPTFAWNLPRGVEATPPAYPVPTRFEAGGLEGFGYSGEIVFPVTLKFPPNLTPGREAEVTVVVDYLICDDDVCIPESAVATARLMVGFETEPDDETAGMLASSRKRLPTSPADAGVRVTSASHDRVEVELPRGARDAGLFALPPAGVEASAGAADVQGNVARFAVTSRVLGDASAQVPAYEAVVAWTGPDGRRGVVVTVPREGP